MMIKTTSLLGLSVIAISTLFFASSCKKSNSNSNNLSATISGSGYSAAQVQAADVYGVIGVVGMSISGKDTTGFAVQFDDTATVGKKLDINGLDMTEVSYQSKTASYDSWFPSAHGTLTLSTYDKTGKRVAGTFSGTLYSSTGDSVVITNGSFNSSYLVP
ncbi:hypothetical protein ACQ86N_19290 [Puia sp. P3]|uniref:hypothetical protein n=1 Tax=Puia sp. P3 TaxID=3423952 RepID=UPI003D6697FE